MGNCGDEFLAAAVLSLLERCGVDRSHVAMLSGNVMESEKIHGVCSFDRWSLKETAQAAKDSETFLLGGGGIFQDSSSFISPWYYWCVMKIAALCGCKVWAVGQSVGPLNHCVNRMIARNAFSDCKYVSLRDAHSHDFLGGRGVLCDDLVLTLPDEKISAQKENVLVNFRPAGGLERAAAKSFSASSWSHGKKIVGVAMSQEDVTLMEAMQHEELLRLDELYLCNTLNWQSIFSMGATAFGMRLHFGVLCLKRDIPCTLVPYDPKVSDFAIRWGGGMWNGAFDAPRPWNHRFLLDKAVQTTIHTFQDGLNRVMNV